MAYMGTWYSRLNQSGRADRNIDDQVVKEGDRYEKDTIVGCVLGDIVHVYHAHESRSV